MAVAVLLAATFIFLLAGCTQPALTSPPPPTETPLTISTEATLIPQNSLIASIDVLDPLTLRFTLNRPDAAFLQLAFPAFSPQSPANLEKYAEGGDLMRNPVGTGPFRFEEWVQGDHITLRRNDAYWGEKPVLDTVNPIVRSRIPRPASWNSKPARLTASTTSPPMTLPPPMS